MRTLLDTLLGVLDLAWMVLTAKGAWNGRYWRWRRQTAFGRGLPPRGELIRGLLDYARWVHAMRRWT